MAENTEEKKLLPEGDVREPPGVLASSAVDARIDGKPFEKPTLALARRDPDNCTVLGLVLELGRG